MNSKNLAYWLGGSVSLLLAMLLVSGLELGVASLDTNALLTMAIALLLVMFGGLLWVGLAMTVRE